MAHSPTADLQLAIQRIYDPLHYAFSDLLPEPESAEYNACIFFLDQRAVKFRTAKITPTKTGQFVTLWKRDAAGITQPHDASDPTELYIISTRKDNLCGQFVFPRSVLVQQGILSSAGKEGKRGFRVYPPWDKAANPQAIRTQKWQLEFFLDLSDGTLKDMTRAGNLYKAT